MEDSCCTESFVVLNLLKSYMKTGPKQSSIKHAHTIFMAKPPNVKNLLQGCKVIKITGKAFFKMKALDLSFSF
ncbi:hypothetical protein XELAEV_18033180mg [Xenopus laevis]|uniref:Uncharacterized protein n=1 Tax=Xenopus laevis TaxID=8355 RepID=A0A974HDR7_XENLA|nr:hypothetical protein XELAEV_18033180mg [Xenopus laevis]